MHRRLQAYGLFHKKHREKRRAKTGHAGRRVASGQAVIETIGSIIMFTILVTLMMSITVYLYFQQALVTCAREGARQASLNSNLGATSTQNNGKSTVQTYIQDSIKQMTGQTYSASVATITVTPPSDTSLSPDQTPGNRKVRVVIQWNMTNPIGVAGFLNALHADGSAFATIPVYATATMRYEE